MPDSNETKTRLNKFISESGFCSRREADRMIEQGRVLVNGKKPELGTKVSTIDDIKIDGRTINKKAEAVYIAFNKPVGITCTTDKNIPDNIVNYINYPERIFHIGRLDKPSEGLIFLTSDGDIVNKILRAGNNHEKEYVVTVNKPITPDFINNMSNGVSILDTVTKKCSVIKTGKNIFTITLTQGLNRQIRRMCQALDYEVLKLKRTRIMNVKIDGIKTGEWRYLTEQEMKVIHEMIATSSNTEEASVLDMDN